MGNVPERTTDWYIEGWDLVNNYARTDGDADDKGAQDFSFTVDRSAPQYVSSMAGIGYDAADSTEVRDSASVKVVFGEAIDSSRLRIDDFAVQGVDVVGIQHPNNKKKTETDDQGTLADASASPPVTDADAKKDDETICVADKALGATTPVVGRPGFQHEQAEGRCALR